MKFDISGFSENLSRKIKLHSNRTIHINIHFGYISLISSDESCRENQNTHFVFSIFFSRKQHRLWDNVEKNCNRTGQATDDKMTHAHCMLDTYVYNFTHSEYVIFIAFPLQQWLHERASMLRYSTLPGLYHLSMQWPDINFLHNAQEIQIIHLVTDFASTMYLLPVQWTMNIEL